MKSQAFLIAAPQSGSGKTTVCLAIMAALARRGLRVAPFKCGPDFIDPGYHRLVTGRPSINLDAWMCPEAFVAETFRYHAADADIAVIEGVMGLFDGMAASPREGSSAQIAALTGAPVVLVVNARGMAASAAALVRGFVGFDPTVRIAGVIFNNVGSPVHGELLRQALADALPQVRVFGCIPRDEGLAIPSRHLGLVTAEDNPLPDEFIGRLAAMAEEWLDLDGLAELSTTSGDSSSSPHPHPNPLPGGEWDKETPAPSRGGMGRGWGSDSVRIAVARDAAFCFCYDDNLRLLREAGADVVFFSPLADRSLPPDIGGIYLPGGYPELHADRLANNLPLLKEIRQLIEVGMPVYAECGGLIYLTEGLEKRGDFVGVFPVRARMLPKRKALGYRQVAVSVDTVLGNAGTTARGHEFHYSEIGDLPPEVARCYRVSRNGSELGMEGYGYKACLASYVHLHFGSNPAIAPAFVRACKSHSAMLKS